MRAIYYHSVLAEEPGPDAFAPNSLSAVQLQAHAEELARNWRVLSLAEICEHLDARRSLPEGAVHVSFDDGFRNNLLAAEIFEARRLPWTLFAVSGAVLDGYTPWSVRLADALGSASRPASFEGEVYDLRVPAQAFRLKERVKREVMRAPARAHVEVLDAALDRAGLAGPVETAWPFLTAAELADLAGRGVEIGNHSATHPNLVNCDDAELNIEVIQSRARLAAAIGRPVRFFAYPDGRFNSRVVKVAGEGHDAAMATWTHGAPLARFRMRRYAVGPTLDDLRSVLARGYPITFRRRRLKWALRRTARRALRGLPWTC